MKTCTHCKRSCYDTELYCPDCGKAMPGGLTCTYCNAPIDDLDAKHCGNCGGLLVFDRYPKHKGTVHCVACGKPKPPNSRYCTSCGVLVESMLPKKRFTIPKPVAIILSIILYIVQLPINLGFTMGLADFIWSEVEYNFSDFDDYDYDYDYDYNDTSSAYTPSTYNGEYKVLDVELLHEQLGTIKEGDYIEVTGYIEYRSGYSCTLIPDNFTKENRDNSVEFTWGYENPDGDFLADYYTVGEKVTIRGKVDYCSTYSSYITADGIEIVDRKVI